eukprot:scaffold63067_cov31-Tisochrysis_lutea.AAC.2
MQSWITKTTSAQVPSPGRLSALVRIQYAFRARDGPPCHTSTYPSLKATAVVKKKPSRSVQRAVAMSRPLVLPSRPGSVKSLLKLSEEVSTSTVPSANGNTRTACQGIVVRNKGWRA